MTPIQIFFAATLLFGQAAAQALECKTPMRSEGRASPGIFYLMAFGEWHLMEGNYITGVDERGKCVFEKHVDQPAFDLQTHWIDGKKYFSYAEASGLIYNLSSVGTRVVLDENWNLVKKIRYTKNSASGPVDFDVHDFQLFDLDHFATIHYLPQFNPEGSCVFDSQLSEVENGDIVYVWSALASLPHPREDQNGFWGDFRGLRCTDYYHLNSIQKVDSPEGFLISLKAPSSILFVPKRSPTAAWALGGLYDEFNIPKNATFSLQHSAHWDAKRQTLRLLDNGTSGHGLRVLEFELDIAKRKIRKWRVVFASQRYSESGGLVEKCGDDCYNISTGAFHGAALIQYDTRSKTTKFKLFLQHGLISYRIHQDPSDKRHHSE